MKKITKIFFWLCLAATSIGAANTSNALAVSGLSHSNFTMLDQAGNMAGGTNDVAATWNGLTTTDIADTNFGNMTIASSTPYFGALWDIHHIRVFAPGSYTFDSTCSLAELDSGIAICNGGPFLSMTVKPDQIGVHMLFDYNGTFNMDILNVYDINAVFITSSPGGLFTGINYGPYPWSGPPNPTTTKWRLASTDIDGDGISGIALVDGPSVGRLSPNFNLDIAEGDSNLSVLEKAGNRFFGTNNVVAGWNGTTTADITDTNFDNMTISSNQPVKGFIWEIHHIRVFSEGTYTFDSSCTIAELEAGTTACAGGPFLSMTVGSNQIGVHMLCDFFGSFNIDIVNLYDINAVFAPGTTNKLLTGAAYGPYPWSGVPAFNTRWRLASIDSDGDGIPGTGMVDGPFVGYSFNFNLFRVVPDETLSNDNKNKNNDSGSLSLLELFLLIPFVLKVFRKNKLNTQSS